MHFFPFVLVFAVFSVQSSPNTDQSEIALHDLQDMNLLQNIDLANEQLLDNLVPDESFFSKAMGLFKLVSDYLVAQSTYVLTFFCFLLVLNTAFVAFAMGYLLKEEHYVIRAIKLNTKIDVVWRAVSDFKSYSLWRNASVTVSEKTGAGSWFTLTNIWKSQTKFYVTEFESKKLLSFKTHPLYKPKKYAVPIVMPGAPIPQNINASQKNGSDSNVLKLEPSPVFYDSSVPFSTQHWMIELKNAKDGGTVVYITYIGTFRSRFFRFWYSLVGFDAEIERYLSGLSQFLGESSATVKPQMGVLPNME